MKPTSDRPHLVCWSMAWTVVFFIALWLMDFPKPMVDDLYYCGAGLNMAAGGDFSNPFLARVEYPSHLYFVYPPLHSYALLAWLRVMGVSAASMTGFVALMYVITSVGVIALLRRHGAPGWLEWLVPLGVATALLPFGLRPEAFAIGLAMAGFALFECGSRSAASIFFAFLLMFLGGSAAPRMTPFVGALAAFAAFRLWQNTTAMPRRRIWSALILGAMLATCLIFLWLIDFRLSEFWQTFHYNAVKLVGGSKLALLKFFWKTYIRGDWFLPITVLTAGLFLLALRSPAGTLARLATFLACGFPVAALIGGLGYGTIWWIILILFLSAASVLERVRSPRLWAACLSAAVLLAMLMPDKGALIQIAGNLGGKIQNSVNEKKTEALALRPGPGHALLLDHSVARYVFDYKTPPGSIDWGTATLFPGHYLDTRLWKRGDIFLLSPPAVELLRRYTMLDQPATEKWAVLGSTRTTVSKYPRQVFILKVESCEGVRPEFIPPGSSTRPDWLL